MATTDLRFRLATAQNRLVRPPTLRTSQEEDRSATWTELFFDLVFVVAVSRVTTILAGDRTGRGIAWFIGIMLLVVWSWTNYVVYSERFDTDDVIHRLLKMSAMISIAGVALAAPSAPSGASSEFALSYLLTRLILIVFYARAFRHVRDVRPALGVYLGGFGLSALLWAMSLVVSGATRPVLWIVAGLVEFTTPLFGWRGFGEHAFNLRHLSERFGQFMLIVLGEAVAGIVGALSNVRLQDGAILAAIAAGLLVFSIWWHNFDVLQQHLPEGRWTVLYVYAAVPVFIAVAALGVALDVAIEGADEPLSATTRGIVSGALATYLVVPTIVQLGGTTLDLDVATITRFVAAAALLLLSGIASSMAAETFVIVAAAIVVAQLALEVTVAAAGLRDD